jgi:small subunit ribosomal protein S21
MTMQVVVYNDFEGALKTFSKQFKNSGLLKELKLKESFESKSERRKRKDREAVRRMRKRERI